MTLEDIWNQKNADAMADMNWGQAIISRDEDDSCNSFQLGEAAGAKLGIVEVPSRRAIDEVFRVLGQFSSCRRDSLRN